MLFDPTMKINVMVFAVILIMSVVMYVEGENKEGLAEIPKRIIRNGANLVIRGLDKENKLIDIPRKINKIQAGTVDHVLGTDEKMLELLENSIGNYKSELDHVINF